MKEQVLEKLSASVLIVDDDPDFLKAQEFVLSSEGVHVLTAASYSDALKKIETSNLDLVISDIQMPGGSGIDLLKWAKGQKSQVPIVLITGFLDLLTTQAAKELGAYGFLPKPVKKDELLALISGLNKPSGSPAEFLESGFARVALEDFVSGKTLAVAIYVRFADGRFLKIAHTGEDLDFDRISSLKEKGVHELWIGKDDFKKYVELNEKVTKAVLSGDGENSRKIRLLNHSCEMAFESVRLMGVTPSDVGSVKAVFESSIGVLTAAGSGLDLLERIHAGGKDLSSHSAAVGLLCTMIAGVMGWHSKKNITALTLGGFLHDIGMLGMDFSLHGKEPSAMEAAARDLYLNHPQAGVAALHGIYGIPLEVNEILLNHHENSRGNGFPAKKLGSQIFPMARIVSLADEFCAYWSKVDSKRRLSASDGLEEFLKGKKACFDKGVVLALECLLKSPNLETAAKEYRLDLGKVARI